MLSEAMQSFPYPGCFTAALEAGPLNFRNLSSSLPHLDRANAAPNTTAASIVDLTAVVEAAREEGRCEAIAKLQGDMEQRVRAERDHVTSALEGFIAERRRYFSGLEKEVVRLALAIAERVLHRESAMDPTLLAGAARVVLEQVDQASAAILLVAPGEMSQWRTAIATLGREIDLQEEASLERGACLLQTEAGSFELGLRSQLCEIERGFFELLGRSPVASA